jgi:hypothetical protein
MARANLTALSIFIIMLCCIGHWLFCLFAFQADSLHSTAFPPKPAMQKLSPRVRLLLVSSAVFSASLFIVMDASAATYYAGPGEDGQGLSVGESIKVMAASAANTAR